MIYLMSCEFLQLIFLVKGDNIMENFKENKMGVMPIGRLILTMSVPIMISMLIQALYNIVDSMYVAMISEEALTAVSIAFPYQNLMIAVATGTGVGVNSLLSRNLGERDFMSANKTANISLTIALIISALFALLGFVIIKPFLSFQTENPVIFSEAKSYLLIVSTFSFGLFGQIATERLLQATGKTVYSMITQALGAIINIILDPIMIFTFKMGIAGAAYATVIAQIIATLTGILLNIHINKELTLSVKLMKIDFDIVKKIYVVGIPSIVMGSIGSVMTFCINKILVSFTETAVAVFGAYFKLQSFIFMPVFGLNNGIVPIMAYNLGAQKTDRIKKTIKLSMIYATSFMLLGFIVFQTIPHVLLGNLFNASAKMLSIGIPALKIISIAFIFAGICIVTISVPSATR